MAALAKDFHGASAMALHGVQTLPFWLALGGVATAWWFYLKQPAIPTAIGKALSPIVRVLENKYYLDNLYTGVIAGSTTGPLARAANWCNQNIIDGVVNGIGTGARKIAGVVYVVADQIIIDGAVNGSGRGSEGAGQLLRKIQTGKVQQYASILFAGAVVLAGVLVFVV
jgi:NADH-quinone oxidoreductase subunit L